MTDHAHVTLDVTRHWCRRHLEPYRAAWPAGVGAATVAVFDAAAEHPDVLAACGYSEADGQPADVHRLQEAIMARGPACCLISRDRLAQIHDATVPAPFTPGEPKHITAHRMTEPDAFLAAAFGHHLDALCGHRGPLVPGGEDRPVCDDCARHANAAVGPAAQHLRERP